MIEPSAIAERLARVEERIGAAARRSGRRRADVLLVAVTKTFPAHVVRAGLDAGITDLGENRAQELVEKVAAIGAGPRWHFIGHLQTNKVRSVVGRATLIHSIDRLGLAEAIDRRARSLGIVQDVLIEVNVSGEASKGGVEPARAAALAGAVDGLEGVRVRGLMTVPALPVDPEDARPSFRALERIGRTVRADLPDARELSMGMTADLEVAIEEGATIVRVGRAIFGPRAG